MLGKKKDKKAKALPTPPTEVYGKLDRYGDGHEFTDSMRYLIAGDRIAKYVLVGEFIVDPPTLTPVKGD